MDASILTTIFCLILLVLTVLELNELMILKRKINAHMDRTDLHSDKLHTILSILQQIEAKQDLIFNNAPPASSEMHVDPIGEDLSWNTPKSELPHLSLPQVIVDYIKPKSESVVKAAKKAKGDFEARLPYHKSTIDNGTIALEAPRRGAKPGVKRGPYKKKPPKT